MTEKELYVKEMGEGNLDLKFVDGKLMFIVAYDTKGMDATLEMAFESEYFLDKLAAVIPGKLDDAVIEMLKGALK